MKKTDSKVFTTLGSSTHSKQERQKHDYYSTDPRCVDDLLRVESFNYAVWEPACGEGHISKRLEQFDFRVKSSDLIDRQYGEVKDFLSIDVQSWTGDIITNPPYKYAQEFVEKSLNIVATGNKIAMFLKLQFLEGQKRKELFKIHPPKTIYVYSQRQVCAMNGKTEEWKKKGSAIAYCWFVWVKGYNGKPQIEWI